MTYENWVILRFFFFILVNDHSIALQTIPTHSFQAKTHKNKIKYSIKHMYKQTKMMNDHLAKVRVRDDRI